MTEHDPYWPLVQKRAANGEWLVYNWYTDRWERELAFGFRSDDIEPGTDWTSEKPL